MTTLREAAQQALEAWGDLPWYQQPTALYPQMNALSAALAQEQAVPDHETRAELAEQHVVQLAEERDHYRALWQKAQQAEPFSRDAIAHTQTAWKMGYETGKAEGQHTERERIKAANAPEIAKINAHIKALEEAVAAIRARSNEC